MEKSGSSGKGEWLQRVRLYQKPEIPAIELSILVFNHSQTNCTFRRTTELSLSGTRLFLRVQPKDLADK